MESRSVFSDIVEVISSVPPEHRELRFTRNRAGTLFLVTGFILITLSIFFQLTGYDIIIPYLPARLPIMHLCVLIPAACCLYLGSFCLKHAAVIVTPLGIEILPMIRPEKTMRWFIWQQLHSVAQQKNKLILELTNGDYVQLPTLAMSSRNRILLFHSLQTRIQSLLTKNNGTSRKDTGS